MRQDWQRAYGALHPDSQKGLTAREFTRLAETYRFNLGFNPEVLHVQSCAEQGTEAVAHVVLSGPGAAKQRRYKDAVVLRKAPRVGALFCQIHLVERRTKEWRANCPSLKRQRRSFADASGSERKAVAG